MNNLSNDIPILKMKVNLSRKHMSELRGISPEYVGPCAWTTLHASAFGMPDVLTEEQRQAMAAMVNGMTITFPCPECRSHLKKHLNKHPVEPHTMTRDTIFDFTVSLHNIVNKMLGKSVVSTEFAKQRYAMITSVQGRCLRNSTSSSPDGKACEVKNSQIPKPKCDLMGTSCGCLSSTEQQLLITTIVLAILFVVSLGVIAWIIMKSRKHGKNPFKQDSRRVRIDCRHNRKFAI
jgi:hypothetical protein